MGTIRVWDPLVRVFHWSLVVLFFVAYFTGEEENLWHIYAGYGVAGLVVFRVVWGFVGSRHARFSDFVRGPRAVWLYLRGVLAGDAPRHIGHNPAGGWMILALLFTLAVVSFSGMKVYAIEEGLGPLAAGDTVSLVGTARASDEDDDEDDEEEGHAGEHDEAAEEFWEEVHEASANLMLLLVALHVLGVLVSSRLHGENLVRAMFTGRKPAP